MYEAISIEAEGRESSLVGLRDWCGFQAGSCIDVLVERSEVA